MTAITSLYGIDNQSKKEIAIHNKKEQTAIFRPTAQAPRWKKLFAPLARVYHKTLIPSSPQYSARIYEQTDDDILAALDPSKLTTQAERESYFRRFGSLPARGAWIEPAISCILLSAVVYLRWDGVGVSSSHLVDFAMVCGISDCSLFVAMGSHFFSYLSGHFPPSERVVKRHPNIVNNKDITGSTTGLAMIAVSGSPSDVSIT